MPAGAIVVVQRGTCPFAQKFLLADQVGAGAMLLSNEGNIPALPDRTLPLWFNVDGLTTPSAAVTVETATALANGVQKGLTGLTARIRMDWRPGTYPTQNVIAETKTGDPNNVIVVGAHLDSVGTGLRHQRQRVRLGGAARDGQAHQQDEAAQQGPLHLVQRRGVRPARLGGLRREPGRRPAEQDRGDVELRHDRLAELRAVRLRRRPGQLPAGAWRPGGASRLGRDRADLPRLLRGPGARERADGVRRTLRLRAVHRGRDPGRRPVHGRRGDQDAGAGRAVRRHRRASRSTSVTTRAATTSST